MIVINYDQIFATNDFIALRQLFDSTPTNFISAFNMFLGNLTTKTVGNHQVDLSSITKEGEYLLCDYIATPYTFYWSNDGRTPIEISCAQHHKCHCDRYLVFNQGCKCGGI